MQSCDAMGLVSLFESKKKKKAIEEKSNWEESMCFFAWRFYPKAFFYCSTMEEGSNAFSNVCS